MMFSPLLHIRLCRNAPLPSFSRQTPPFFSSMAPAFTIFAGLLLAATASASLECKVTPYDPEWPSHGEWSSLNSSINGQLLSALPVASSCWHGNPFDSPVNCSTVQSNWANAAWQSRFPEAIDYPIYANNSCLPPNASGYVAGRGCSIGGLPQYIVNATSEDQIATALKWAAASNIRVVVKGTGHDLNGRYVCHLINPILAAMMLTCHLHVGRAALLPCPSGRTTSAN
jgi:hypothetical protein